MFAARRHARASLYAVSFPRARTWQYSHRNQSTESLLDPPNELAQRLEETAIFTVKGRLRKGKNRPGDPHRVNIVSAKLCDDILGYIGPSLERHVGCDLIDLNPGVGLWSTKLHDFLQPRKHILLEPDDVLYKPFLEPLLSRENVTLIPKSGIVYGTLGEVLSPEFLPHQKLHDFSRPAERNDTLLVIGNLAHHPKKRYKFFESLTTLVIYQLIASVRAGNSFQKYGRVRFILWTVDEKRRVLPHSVHNRRRLAHDAESALEWINEVAGADLPPNHSHTGLRDAAIDLASMRATAERMRKSGMTIPAGRETALARAHRMLGETQLPVPGEQSPYIAHPWLEELRQLEERKAKGEQVGELLERQTYSKLMRRRNYAAMVGHQSMGFMRSLTAIADMYSIDPELAAEADDLWNSELRCATKFRRVGFTGMRDNLHVWYQDPPVLMYDRRLYEKLMVDAAEFFPQVPCTLIDFQPKAMHPLLHDMHPGLDPSLKACMEPKGGAAVVGLLTKAIASGSSRPVESMLQQLWPGLETMILPQCPSLFDRRLGGSPVSRLGGTSCRALNQTQIIELVEAYVRSPHAPSHWELVKIDPAKDLGELVEPSSEPTLDHDDDGFDETLEATDEAESEEIVG